MPSMIKKLLLSVMLMSGIVSSTAKASTNDFLGFIDLKKFKFSLQEEFRFKETGDAFFYQFTDFQAKYDFNKYFDLFVDYRLIFKQKSGNWDQYNVIMPGFTLKYPEQKWGKVEVRTRGEAGLDYSPVQWALNVQPKYNTPWKWTKFDINPFVADEMFFDVRNNMDFTVNRIRIGVDLKLANKIKSQLGYYYETYGNKSGHSDVLSFSVKFDF